MIRVSPSPETSTAHDPPLSAAPSAVCSMKLSPESVETYTAPPGLPRATTLPSWETATAQDAALAAFAPGMSASPFQARLVAPAAQSRVTSVPEAVPFTFVGVPGTTASTADSAPAIGACSAADGDSFASGSGPFSAGVSGSEGALTSPSCSPVSVGTSGWEGVSPDWVWFSAGASPSEGYSIVSSCAKATDGTVTDGARMPSKANAAIALFTRRLNPGTSVHQTTKFATLLPPASTTSATAKSHAHDVRPQQPKHHETRVRQPLPKKSRCCCIQLDVGLTLLADARPPRHICIKPAGVHPDSSIVVARVGEC